MAFCCLRTIITRVIVINVWSLLTFGDTYVTRHEEDLYFEQNEHQREECSDVHIDLIN